MKIRTSLKQAQSKQAKPGNRKAQADRQARERAESELSEEELERVSGGTGDRRDILRTVDMN